MKNVQHRHQIPLPRLLLLMTILAAFTSAGTITTLSPEGKKNLTLVLSPQTLINETVEPTLILTKAQTWRTVQEETTNRPLLTQSNPWTTPRINMPGGHLKEHVNTTEARLTGGPSTPERGTSAEQRDNSGRTASTENATTVRSQKWEDSITSTNTINLAEDANQEDTTLLVSTAISGINASSELLKYPWTSTFETTSTNVINLVLTKEGTTPSRNVQKVTTQQKEDIEAPTSLPETTIEWTPHYLTTQPTKNTTSMGSEKTFTRNEESPKFSIQSPSQGPNSTTRATLELTKSVTSETTPETETTQSKTIYHSPTEPTFSMTSIGGKWLSEKSTNVNRTNQELRLNNNPPTSESIRHGTHIQHQNSKIPRTSVTEKINSKSHELTTPKTWLLAPNEEIHAPTNLTTQDLPESTPVVPTSTSSEFERSTIIDASNSKTQNPKKSFKATNFENLDQNYSGITDIYSTQLTNIPTEETLDSIVLSTHQLVTENILGVSEATLISQKQTTAIEHIMNITKLISSSTETLKNEESTSTIPVNIFPESSLAGKSNSSTPTTSITKEAKPTGAVLTSTTQTVMASSPVILEPIKVIPKESTGKITTSTGPSISPERPYKLYTSITIEPSSIPTIKSNTSLPKKLSTVNIGDTITNTTASALQTTPTSKETGQLSIALQKSSPTSGHTNITTLKSTTSEKGKASSVVPSTIAFHLLQTSSLKSTPETTALSETTDLTLASPTEMTSTEANTPNKIRVTTGPRDITTLKSTTSEKVKISPVIPSTVALHLLQTSSVKSTPETKASSKTTYLTSANTTETSSTKASTSPNSIRVTEEFTKTKPIGSLPESQELKPTVPTDLSIRTRVGSSIVTLGSTNSIPVESKLITTKSTVTTLDVTKSRPTGSSSITLTSTAKELLESTRDIMSSTLGSTNITTLDSLTTILEYTNTKPLISLLVPTDSMTSLIASTTNRKSSQSGSFFTLSASDTVMTNYTDNTPVITEATLIINSGGSNNGIPLKQKPSINYLAASKSSATENMHHLNITQPKHTTFIEEVTKVTPTKLTGFTTSKLTTPTSTNTITILTESLNTTPKATISIATPEPITISVTTNKTALRNLNLNTPKLLTSKPTDHVKVVGTTLNRSRNGSRNNFEEFSKDQIKCPSRKHMLPKERTTLPVKNEDVTLVPDPSEFKTTSKVDMEFFIKTKTHVQTKQKEIQVQNTLKVQTEEKYSTKIVDALITTQRSFIFLHKLPKTSILSSTTEIPTLKRRKIKLPKQHLLNRTLLDPLSTKYIPNTKHEDLSFTTVEPQIGVNNVRVTFGIEAKTSTYPTKLELTPTTKLSHGYNLGNKTTKSQWFLLNFNSNNENGTSNETKLTLPKGELIYQRKLTTISPKLSKIKSNNDIKLQNESTTTTVENITNKTMQGYVPKSKNRTRYFKSYNTKKILIEPLNKKPVQRISLYNFKNIEDNGESKKSKEKKMSENKVEVNRIEEILLKYYEEFKNRNVMTNNQEQKNKRKSIPTKRKFKIKKRPVTNDKKRDSSPNCIQQTVVNRKYLNSSHMSLDYIVKEHFINYRVLEYLDLSHNSLMRFNLSTLNNLNTLKYVSLEFNNLTDLYPINFYTLRNLEYLDLSNNHISKIRNFTFTNMRTLKYLKLNNNFISKINATTLRGLQGCVHLDLSGNKIDYLHEDSLPRILNIKYLNLSRNKISTLGIRNLKNIEVVALSHNEITSLSNITLGNLTNQMKILKVNNNLLEHLNENIFKNFSKLIYLDVSNNKLNYISPSTFQYLYNLIFLNVSCQNILSLDQKGSTYNIEYNLKRNNINHSYGINNIGLRNKTTEFQFVTSYPRDTKKNSTKTNSSKIQTSSKSKHLKEDNQKESNQSKSNRIMKRTNLANNNKAKFLDPKNSYNQGKLYANKMQKRITSTMRNLPDIIDFKLHLLAGISQRLKQFDCINVNLNQVPKVLTHSIQILNLKLNRIKNLQLGDLDDYPLLQVLILSQNKIKSIETDSLGRLDFLKILLVDNNKLKSVPISLPENIKILNLNFNIISRIGQEDFFDLVNLEELYIQGNKVESIPPNTFIFLRNLKHLDISNNPIKTINSIVLSKLNYINLSNLRHIQVESNFSDRFPIEDGFSLLGIKLEDSSELCRLLLNDYAFVLTLKQIKYLNCDETSHKEDPVLQDATERKNETCETTRMIQGRESKILNTKTSKSNTTNRSQTKFSASQKMINNGQGNRCVNNESNIFQIRNSNTVRKRSNKAYRKTINSNLTVNNILLDVNKCTICKVERIYEPLFEFNLANVENYIENIISFANILNNTNTNTYLKYVMEEQQASCLHRGNKTRGGYIRKPDVNIENYTSMNYSTHVLKFPMRNNMSLLSNKRKTPNNRIFMENGSENEGIFVITDENDIPTTEFSFGHKRPSRIDTKIAYKHNSYLQDTDVEMNDQAFISENYKNKSTMLNNSKLANEENKELINPLKEENKFSIVKDNKKNVILKLNRNINNGTEEKLTENYDQLEIKYPSKKINNKGDNKEVGLDGSNLIKSNKKVKTIKNNDTIQSGEYNTHREGKIKSGKTDEDQKLVSTRMESSWNTFYRILKSDQSVKKSNQSEIFPNDKLDSRNKEIGTILRTENTNNKYKHLNQIRSYLKNYQSIDSKDFGNDEGSSNGNHDRELNNLESLSNLNIHKDAQYEMNIVDTDAEFLDIIDDNTEKSDDITVRTLETSKYHELVSDNTQEGLHYHTGMLIFLMIIVLMIVGAFLALTFQWNTLFHYYCHHYVTYRNNGHSDDEDRSDLNFDRIEMLDNTDVYSIS